MKPKAVASRLHYGALLGLAAGLSACATSPIESPQALHLAASRAIPQAVSIAVICDGEACFGKSEEWATSLIAVFRKLKVAADVWEAKEERPADLLLEVNLRRRPAADSAMKAETALFEFLLLSTVPFVWWIPDVDVDLGLSVEVVRTRAAPGQEPRKLVQPVPVPPLRTSLRERYPFFSWPTLGSVLIPPFFFSAGDPEHLRNSAGERVRLEVAIKVAEFLKNTPLGENELLSNLAIQREAEGFVLTFEPAPDLGKVTARLDDDAASAETMDLPAPGEEGERGQFPLKKIPARTTSEGQLLRIEAESRLDGRRLLYSVPLPSVVETVLKG